MTADVNKPWRFDRDLHGLFELRHIHWIDNGCIWNGSHHAQVFCGLVMDASGIGNPRGEPHCDASECLVPLTRPHTNHHLVIGTARDVTRKACCNRYVSCFRNACRNAKQILFGHTNIQMLVRKFIFHPHNLAIFAQVRTHNDQVFIPRTQIKTNVIKRGWMDNRASSVEHIIGSI